MIPAQANESGPPKVVIIGGGIAGLSCGCYLQMNGIATEILEAGGLPGGLCTAWHRGPYVFDGCLRWLMGGAAFGVLPGVDGIGGHRRAGDIRPRRHPAHRMGGRDEFLRAVGFGSMQRGSNRWRRKTAR